MDIIEEIIYQLENDIAYYKTARSYSMSEREDQVLVMETLEEVKENIQEIVRGSNND